MEKIAGRIKELRGSLNLSQTAFGEGLGLGLGAVRNLEMGNKAPSDSQINLICKIYHVNRQWLTTGNGEMFSMSERDRKILDLVDEILVNKSDSFKADILALISELNNEDWSTLKRITDKLIELQVKDKA